MEVRFDKILGHKSIIVERRKKRPFQFGLKEKKEKRKITCFFCPGMEKFTPKEFLRKGDENFWEMRMIKNKFPIFEGENQGHFVIVEAREHNKKFWDLEQNEIFEILKFWRKVYDFLDFELKPKYIFLFKNEGEKAGASIEHMHSQVIAVDFVPDMIKKEIKRSYDENGNCLYCKLMEEEKQQKERVIFETENFLTLSSYAPRFNYEVFIGLKKHLSFFKEFSDSLLNELSLHFRNILKGLKLLGLDFNIYFHNSVEKNFKLHFHIRILPRDNIHGGYELGAQEYVITVLPETCAKFFKEIL